MPYTDRERVGQHCAWAGFRLLLLRDAGAPSSDQARSGVVQYLPSPLAQALLCARLSHDRSFAQHLSRDPIPVVWSTTTFTQEPAFWEEARAHGVRHCWAIATHGSTRTVGILSLARSEQALTARELGNVEAQYRCSATIRVGLRDNHDEVGCRGEEIMPLLFVVGKSSFSG